MKATTKVNCDISSLIERALKIRFKNKEFSLGNWGDVDNYCELQANRYILLECEKAQKHPNTNVAKLYPYLEECPNTSVMLLHYFFPDNRAPKNRIELCDFIATKMSLAFPGRFRYIKLPPDLDMMIDVLKSNRKLFNIFLNDIHA